MAVKKKSGLGKGLDAIFGENLQETPTPATELRISALEPNRNQPRKEFREEQLAELADSIQQHGVLQPLLVRPLADGGYQIVAGERRWRAARMAGLQTVPAIVRDLEEDQVFELALIENLQREDLNPLEEAMGYQSLLDTYGMTQEEVSKSVGKSRSAIANALRLLHLPKAIQTMLQDGSLSAGHARALLAFPEEKIMLEVAEQIVQQDLSVRTVEKMAQKLTETHKNAGSQKAAIPYFSEVELSLHDYLKRKVQVSGTEKKGVLQIEFYGQEDLSELMRLLHFDQ